MGRTRVCPSLLFYGAAHGQLPLRYEIVESGLQVSNTIGLPSGTSILPAGDLDGDGYRDYLEAIPTHGVPGALEAYSGRTGAFLLAFSAPSVLGASATLCHSCATGVGDIDQDGHDDIAALVTDTVINPGLIEVYQVALSGADGSSLHATAPTSGFVPPSPLENMGDLNGDGVDDVAFYWGLNPTHLHLRSGVDGSSIATYTLPLGFSPSSPRNARDVNGDGVNDIILGSATYPTAVVPYLSTGAAAVLSGVDGSPLYVYQGPPPAPGISHPIVSDYGSGVDGLGDLDGDGFGEFAVGAPHDGSGTVRIYSGANGGIVGTLIGPIFAGLFGKDFSGCGDVDGDGTPDIVVASLALVGRFRVYSGAGLDLMFEVIGGMNERFGRRVRGLGDLDGDGFPEIGAVFAGFPAQGQPGGLGVFSMGGVRRYGVGLGGLQTLDADWMPAPAGDPAMGSVLCTGGQPGGAGFLGVSLGEANASVMGVPVLIDPNSTQLFFTSPFVFDGTGSYSVSASLRVPPAAGLLVRAQFFDLAPPFGSSNGLEFLLLP